MKIDGSKEQKEFKAPVPFFEVVDEVTKKSRKKSDVKDNEWFEEYFKLELSIEEKNEQNEKAKREIIRRTERYNKNEQEYRKQIDLLHRELRVRKGLIPNAEVANKAAYERHIQDIVDNIETHENQFDKLSDEQIKELARKFKSIHSRMKK